MDTLSDVLRVVRLSGGVFFSARTTAPWTVESPPADQLADLLGIRGECLALFHLVAEGECQVAVDGFPPVDVEADSIVIFPRGHSHRMGSPVRAEPASMARLLPRILDEAEDGRIPHVAYGGGGAEGRLVCGYLRCDQRFNPLIGALPTLIVACPRRGEIRSLPEQGPAEAAGPEERRLDAWLGEALERTLEEVDSEEAGSPAMVTRLTELLYLEVLRRYTRSLPTGGQGWLAAVRHPQVGHALRLMHAEPDRDWTVASLGREVGLSRSALAQRFRELVGDPPMTYLAGWRMQLAQRLLRRPELSIAQVATRVGYSSERAFHRAFKRHVGQPPATWRRGA